MLDPSPKFLQKIPMLGKVRKIITTKLGSVKEAATNPYFYRRGLLVRKADKLSKNNETINQALLDLDDLANYGDKPLTRRKFLQNSLKRAFRRNKPLLDDIKHTPMEQLDDTMDISKMFNYSYMNTADFAGPKPFQSGANWLWNRVAADTGILAGGAIEAGRKVASAAKGQPIKMPSTTIPSALGSIIKKRRATLDALDARSNQKAIDKMAAKTQQGLKNMRAQSPVTDQAATAKNALNDVDYLPQQLGDRRYSRHNETPPIALSKSRKNPFTR